MNKEPIICFGQQPCGFFPKRFLVAKINTARNLQQKIGGKIVFFFHDSDADYRETITIMRDKTTGAEVRLNFSQENKVQKKHSPLYLKRIPSGWQEEIIKQLPRFTDKTLMDIFASVSETNAADFCLAMYKKLGLLDGVEIIKSSSPIFRVAAESIQGEYFADVKYQNEIVRAKVSGLALSPKPLALLHEGGGIYTEFPIDDKIEKQQITPAAKQRFGWMNSIIHCTHYMFGEGEKEYLNFDEFPKVKFIQRDSIIDPNLAWLPTDNL